MKFQLYQIGFAVLATLILLALLSRWVFGQDNSEEVAKLLESAKISEKQAIVADVKHEELKWPKYTIRVGLWGSRKPIPSINGLTTKERAKEWLETAWLGYTIDTWIKLGEKHKIDYTLPLCIAWSDSHLGKALKSTNNLGNYWNNDRGDTIHYDSLDKWIEAIFMWLSQGKYLKWHEYIGTLSWEWRIRMAWWDCNDTRIDQKCYATSVSSWHSNVTNCMSAINNFQIDEWSKFRL